MENQSEDDLNLVFILLVIFVCAALIGMFELGQYTARKDIQNNENVGSKQYEPLKMNLSNVIKKLENDILKTNQ